MSNTINVRQIVHDSIVDGPGIRTTVFTQGCNHNCIGCHNQELLEINDNYLMSIDKIMEDINMYNFTKKVTLSGGEPLLQKNIVKLAKELKSKGYHIILYSGYTLDQIRKLKCSEILNIVDIIIDGKFEIDNQDLMGAKHFRGSSNQNYNIMKKID